MTTTLVDVDAAVEELLATVVVEDKPQRAAGDVKPLKPGCGTTKYGWCLDGHCGTCPEHLVDAGLAPCGCDCHD